MTSTLSLWQPDVFSDADDPPRTHNTVNVTPEAVPISADRRSRLANYGGHLIETIDAWRSGVIQAYGPQERSE